MPERGAGFAVTVRRARDALRPPWSLRAGDALRPPWSLRARVVALSVVVVTVVLVTGGFLLGVALRSTLIDELRRATVLRARAVAALAVQEDRPASIPLGADEETLVQVVIGDAVVASSPNVAGRPPLSLPRPAPGRTIVTEARRLPVEDEQDEGFLVAAVTVSGSAGPVTVYVASSLEDVGETLAAAAGVALVGLPALVAALAAAVWLLVGRTLAPVEAIRAEADAISGRELGRRVPEPPARDEIGRLARTLNRMLDRLQGSAERQRQFVADAAHELRTPVAALRAQLETARDSPRDADWSEVAAGSLAETIRMQTLIEQLLVLARADAGVLATRRPVDLDDVALRVVGAVRGVRTVAFDVSGVEPVQVTGDPFLLEVAVSNLVDNAVRHARSRVAVATGEGAGGVAVLTIDDDGPGVPAGSRDEAFRRFVRLDQARTRDDGGAGLGLAIVDDILTAHGGRVRILDAPLGGARLECRLPLSRSMPPPQG